MYPLYIHYKDMSIVKDDSLPGLEAVFHHLTANSIPAALRELRSLAGYDRALSQTTTRHVGKNGRNDDVMGCLMDFNGCLMDFNDD